MHRSWALAIAAGALILAAGALVTTLHRREPHRGAAPVSSDNPSLVRAAPATAEGSPREPAPSPAAGLDLTRVQASGDALFAPTQAGRVRLTLDPELQRTASALMALHHLPEAAVVLMEVATGRVLVYASHIERGPARDLCAEAVAPSASVFKIVTAAALVEDAQLSAETSQCYSGGEEKITARDLVADPKRDRYCATLAGALGRSINAVFARLAREHLSPSQLESMARRFGYGQPVPFDAPVQPSGLRIPDDPLEFARTAAGFWNSTLSPVEAAEISAIVARHGETVRPTVVEGASPDPGGPPEALAPRRVVTRDTAAQLELMMQRTVSEGTCWRAFHDGRGGAFLPGIPVAGKTGTLTDAQAKRYYTWFTGFAPAQSHPAGDARPGADARASGEPRGSPRSDVPQVSIAVLVVNGPVWQVKANVVAREVLRAYFASKDAPGVSRPSLSTIARRNAAHDAR